MGHGERKTQPPVGVKRDSPHYISVLLSLSKGSEEDGSKGKMGLSVCSLVAFKKKKK